MCNGGDFREKRKRYQPLRSRARPAGNGAILTRSLRRLLIWINVCAPKGEPYIVTLNRYKYFVRRPTDGPGNKMTASEKSREIAPHVRQAAFSCLLLLSFISFFGGAFVAGTASSLAAGLQHSNGLQFVSTNSDSEDDCPCCPACDHNALAGCCSSSAGQFAAIASELALRAVNAHTMAISCDYLIPVSSGPPQIFHPPRPAVQA